MRIRPIRSADQTQLWELLHVALWDPPPAGLRPRTVLEHPDVRIYAEGWGRSDDVGVVAVDGGGVIAGGAWMHPENPAIALYEKLGFRKAGLRRTYHLMIRDLG